MRKRHYVGCLRDKAWEAFSCLTLPHPKECEYFAVIGPFKTKRGAEYMAKYGRGNPHLQTVNDAEVYAKQDRRKL